MPIPKILKYPFKTWERPIALAFLATPICVVCFLIDDGQVQAFGMLIFLLSVTIIVLSFIFLLFKKQFAKAFYTLLFIIAVIIVFGLLLSS